MGIPFVPLAFTNDNPCHIKIVGPCLAIPVVVVLAVVCWPASLFCGCCATERGKRTAMLPNKTSIQIFIETNQEISLWVYQKTQNIHSTSHLGKDFQKKGQVLSREYLAGHTDKFGYFLAENEALQNLQGRQQASKWPWFTSREAFVRKNDIRDHNLIHPNYMGISPAILLEMMVKVAKVKWRSPPVSSGAKTNSSISLQAATFEDSPTMISVKSIKGIPHALRFLGNLPEDVWPTFVQNNPTLKKFIRGMEAHNISTSSGHTKHSSNNMGIIEQTVSQLQRRDLVKPYLDKLTAYASEPEAFAVDAETLMQKALVDATNAALTPQQMDGEEVQEVNMMGVAAGERCVPKLHHDISQTSAMISLEGSQCHPIDLENISLPQGLFQEMPNPFVDKPQKHAAISLEGSRCHPIDLDKQSLPQGLFQGLPNVFDDESPYIMPFHYSTCKYYTNIWTSPFRKAPMIGGPGGQFISAPFQFEEHVEGKQFYQAAAATKSMHKLESMRRKRPEKSAKTREYIKATYRYYQALQQSRLAEGHPDRWYGLPYPAISSQEMLSLELEVSEAHKSFAQRTLMEAVAKDTPVRRKKLEDYDVQTLFPELQPIQDDFGESEHSRPHPVHQEHTTALEKPIGEDCANQMGQSEPEPKRPQAILEQVRLPHPNLELKGEGRPLEGLPILHCEEEISLVRSCPPKQKEGKPLKIDSDEIMLLHQLDVGPVDTPNSKLYTTSRSSLLEGPYSTKKNQWTGKPPTIVGKEIAFANLPAAGVLPNGTFDLLLASEAATQPRTAPNSMCVPGLAYAALSVPAEPTISDGNSCPKCDKSYKYQKALQNHIQICQGPGIPEESLLPIYHCLNCGKMYKKHGNLWSHMESCDPTHMNSLATRYPKQNFERKKARENLVPFPHDDARNSSGKPICEACKSKFTSKGELAKHIKAECKALRMQGSYSRGNKKKLGAPLALSFKEPMSASNFDNSDVEDVSEVTSSTFAAPLCKYGQNIFRAERQVTKNEAYGMDRRVRKGSMAEQLDLVYNPQFINYTLSNLMHNNSSYATEDPTLDGYSGTNGSGNGDGNDSSMGASPTPEPKMYHIGRFSKPVSTMNSRGQAAGIGNSPASELIVNGISSAPVSRTLVLEPGLAEIQDTNSQPTSRKLFSHVSRIPGLPSALFSETQDQQARNGFGRDFPQLPSRSPAHVSAAYPKRRSKESGSSYNKPEPLELEVVTIRCQIQVDCDHIVNLLDKSKEEDARHRIISVSGEDGFVVRIVVRPGFDIAEIIFDELPGVFARSGKRSFVFVRTNPKTLGGGGRKRAREKQEPGLETPDEMPTKKAREWTSTEERENKLELMPSDKTSAKKPRGWNLRKENRGPKGKVYRNKIERQ
ncbi:hypothetical protein V490_07641 [Pseudogymnoascus sp. VKM F-3557]|nr:hypothetical protein V490_07641 [Pseudogymnoascus sp. VKM F-3557]